MDEFQQQDQLNRKNITGEILGFGDDVDFNIDDMPLSPDEAFERTNQPAPDPTADNAIVNVLDLFITTSPAILEKYGYPSPDLEIWRKWAKPNLNVAFNYYVPSGTMVGGAVTMPVIAALLGVAAVGVSYLPVILYHLDKKRKEKEASQEIETEIVQQEPEPEPTGETEHILSVSERLSQMEEQVV